MTSPSTLADRISSAVRASYVGTGFRQQAPRYDPRSGAGARLNGGRFNPPDSFPVLYLCSTAACAVAELRRAAERHPIGVSGFLPRTLYRYEIELTSVLDLTDSDTLGHLGLSPEQLVDEDRSVTQQIGEISHQFGFQAVLNASATGVDAVLAVFIDNLHSGRLDFAVEAEWQTLGDLPPDSPGSRGR